MPLKLIFMGTPDFSVPTLKAVIAAGHEVVAAYSQPPRPAGRGMSERKSPVHTEAEVNGIPVRTPLSLRNDQEIFALNALNADAAVVIAYGLIVPSQALSAPRLGCFNMHASKLPRWRGAAPIQRAIMAGDTTTAAMIMRMDEGLDTGPICLSDEVEIGPNMTAGELHDVLAGRGANLTVRALNLLEDGSLTETPQPEHGVEYASKIDKKEARIDFARAAEEVHNHVRGLSPFPGAWFETQSEGGKPERIKVLRSECLMSEQGTPGTALTDDLVIACSRGAIRLIEVQRAGKRPMTASELLRGFSFPAGSRVLT